MEQIVKLKRSSVANKVPTIADISLGEMAMNTEDGKVYMRKNDDSIIEIGKDIKVLNIANPGNPGNPSSDSFDVTSHTLVVCENAGTKLDLDDTAYSLVLPALPKDKDIVRVMDGYGNAQDVPILVRANGKQIDGSTDDMTCDVSWFDIELIYNTATGSWALGGK